METCKNCGAVIGKLEPAYIWKDNPVCSPCYRRLREQTEPTAAPIDYRAARNIAKAERKTHSSEAPFNDEVILYQTQLHPMIFAVPISAVLLSIAFVPVFIRVRPFLLFNLALFLWGGIASVDAYVRFRHSEFKITSRRLTIKTGFLSHRSMEVLLEKVESIYVDQDLLERLLHSGTVVIAGTGGSKEKFSGIRNALKFRQHATDAIELVRA